MTPNRASFLAQGNQAFRDGDYKLATRRYLAGAQSLNGQSELFPLLEANLTLARRHYLRQRMAARRGGAPARVAVCGWDLAHNPAGRVLTLADAYRRVTPRVEIIGAIFPRWGRDLWPPMQGSKTPCHSIFVEDEADFVSQALQLVAEHPYDLVHLSKPRFPNLVFGLLYSLVWGAQVVWDIDDEELGFVAASEPLPLKQALGELGRLPPFNKLHASYWTRLTVGQVSRFGVATVSNPALQQRYGGKLVPHVRDETRFVPSQNRRARARRRWGIPEHIKVVLFFGTPRRHKGLLETAQAIAALGRDDVWFVIVGEFPDASLKNELQQVEVVNCRFIPDQPYGDIPDIVAIGDYTVLLQEGSSLVAQFQLPAKLVDALAMGLVVFAHVTPATQWLADEGAIIPVKPETLGLALRRQLGEEEHYEKRGSDRKIFLEKLSLSSCEDTLRDIVSLPVVNSQSWQENLLPLISGRIEGLLVSN
ncbi:glycosyltransferase [Halomonas ramblicola]|uniref:glycosyltransferase n=1 Tax=Halomonas ramblicola TaxID=747349 RepID=UPI0025B4A59C|nr:glycosyltransferase [Halomonas ramblicola]MDN3522083.1 glycosyltransferase [Halomonas ramblicola]